MGIARLAVFSDTHLSRLPDGTDGSPDRRLAAAVAAVAREAAPDLVVLPGDIVDDGSVEGCGRVVDAVAVFGVPVLATPGNHDLPDVVTEVFGGANDVDVEGWRILTADTVLPGEIHGAVDAGAVAHALDAGDGRPTVLVVHHPPLSISAHPWFQLLDAADLVAVVAAHPEVRAVVSGHLHRPFHVQLGPTAYLGAPSTWYAIDHDGVRWTKDGGLVGALVIDLDADGTVTWSTVPADAVDTSG